MKKFFLLFLAILTAAGCGKAPEKTTLTESDRIPADIETTAETSETEAAEASEIPVIEPTYRAECKKYKNGELRTVNVITYDEYFNWLTLQEIDAKTREPKGRCWNNSYIYDEQGRIKINYYWSDGSEADYSEYFYDEFGGLSKIQSFSDGKPSNTQIFYCDEHGNILQEYSFDENTPQEDIDEQLLSRFEYEYDENGNEVGKKKYYGDKLEYSRASEYDEQNRITLCNSCYTDLDSENHRVYYIYEGNTVTQNHYSVSKEGEETPGEIYIEEYNEFDRLTKSVTIVDGVETRMETYDYEKLR